MWPFKKPKTDEELYDLMIIRKVQKGNRTITEVSFDERADELNLSELLRMQTLGYKIFGSK